MVICANDIPHINPTSERGAATAEYAIATVAAAGFVTSAGAWLLTGIDYERHAVPGPLLLRIGLILMVATLVDSMAPRPGGETARRW